MTGSGTADPGGDRSSGDASRSAATSEPDDRIGGRVGRFEIRALLGRGGMGDVYRAFDPEREAEVALKLLDGGLPSSWRFLREAEAQAAVDHPHVCPVFEAGKIGEVLFIAMRIVEGPSLVDLREGIDDDQRIRLIRQVALGVHEAHRKGLVHRDLKPGNISVERRPDGSHHPFVMDFGLALGPSAGRTTTAGTVLGTPAYMAPEQALGKGSEEIDRRADVWSLGGTLFFLLTGRAPFVGSALEILVQVADRSPPPLRKLRPDLPAALEATLQRSLSRSPADRHPSAAAFAEDLRRVLEDEPVTSTSGSGKRRWKARLRRHRGLAFAAAAGAVVLLGAGTFGLQRWSAGREDSRRVEELTAEVEGLEETVRLSGLAPPHDRGGERAWARTRLEELEMSVGDLGASARGKALERIGRSFLRLGDPETAARAAADAAALGVDADRLRGESLGELYFEERRAAESVTDEAVRRWRARRAERELRTTALRLLRGAGASGEGRGGDEGHTLLLFLLEGDAEKTIEAAQAEALRRPWDWLPPFRIGEAEEQTSWSLRAEGDDGRALSALLRAREAWSGSAEIARSEPEIPAAVCASSAVLLALRGAGSDEAGTSLEPSLDACRQAVALEPSGARHHRGLARLTVLAAERMDFGAPGRHELLEAARASAQRAVELGGEESRSLRLLAAVEAVAAEEAWFGRHDPRPFLKTAKASLTGLGDRDPEVLALAGRLGVLEVRLALDEGRDPRQEALRADAALSAALRQVPGSERLGRLRLELARRAAAWDVAHGADPAEWIRRAGSTAAGLLRSDPGRTWALRGFADLRIRRARHSIEAGRSPSGDLFEAERALRAALARRPDEASTRLGLAEVDLVRALSGQDRRNEVAAALERAHGILGAPDLPVTGDVWSLRAERLRLEARVADGTERARRLRSEALAAVEWAIALGSDGSEVRLREARILVERAAVSSDARRDADLRAAERALDRALGQAPNLPEALQLRSRLEELAGRPEAARAAREAAAAGNPLLAAGS